MNENQLVMLDLPAAEAARDVAMKRVYDAADPEWINMVKRAIRDVCKEKRYFTSDDVWVRVPQCREPRALGPIIKKAVKAGLCSETGSWQKSKRPACHARPIPVYVSRVYEG